jgi:outer membrane lipoprotein SlyB
VATGDPEGGTETMTEEEKKKKGINNTAKGALIGAGAGAVGGAIINKKNPGKGAVIGGVVGAGAGAVTGVILDKNKKKKDSTAAKSSSKDPESGSTTK